MKNSDFRLILEKGILAPSADNLQPWVFKRLDSQVDIFLDRKNIQNFCDEGYLIPYISAGAVIENMRVAASQLGYEIFVNYLPSSENSLHVASISFSEIAPKIHVHFQVLEARTTNRKFYDSGRSINQDTFTHLTHLAERESMVLKWIKKTDSKYGALSRLLGQADRLRYEIERLHGELIRTLRFSDSDTKITRDGLDLHTFETGPGGPALFKLIGSWKRMHILNCFGMSRLFDLYTQLQMASSQAAGFLLTKNSRPLDYIHGGEIMQRLWHETTKTGLGIQPMEALPIFIINSQLTGGHALNDVQKGKLTKMKTELHSLFGINDENGLIFLFRIGYASPPSARSLRRPLESFIMSS